MRRDIGAFVKERGRKTDAARDDVSCVPVEEREKGKRSEARGGKGSRR
jgi:hypothetical protein